MVQPGTENTRQRLRLQLQRRELCSYFLSFSVFVTVLCMTLSRPARIFLFHFDGFVDISSPPFSFSIFNFLTSGLLFHHFFYIIIITCKPLLFPVSQPQTFFIDLFGLHFTIKDYFC